MEKHKRVQGNYEAMNDQQRRLIHCEKCGEDYSSTYKTCPFCEEDRAIKRGKPIHRKAKDFANRRGGHAIRIMMLLLALILVGTGSVYFFGDAIGSMLGMHETPVTQNEGNKDSDTDKEPSDPLEPSTDLSLASETMTLKMGETAALQVSGGNGTYAYAVTDPSILTVDETGNVTPVAVGTVTVSVTDGTDTVECVITVEQGETTTQPPTQPSGNITLNREDFTMKVGESFQLKAEGTTGPIIWSIEDSAIATISGDGTVTGVSAGVTTAYATVNGEAIPCIVRIR